MAVSIKTNAAAASVAKVSEAAAFEVVMHAATVASKSTASLCAAMTSWFVIATHFGTEKDRLSVKDARDQLETQIAKAKNGVQDQMLTRYIQVATRAASYMLGKDKEHPRGEKATIQLLANAPTAAEAAAVVEHLFTDTWGCNTLNKLRLKLGINPGSSNNRKQEISKRVENSLESVAKAFSDSSKALTERQKEAQLPKVASAIAQQTPVDALVLVITQALNRLADIDTVKPADIVKIAKLASDVARSVAARAKVKGSQPKASAKVVVAAKAKGKGKPARVTAH